VAPGVNTVTGVPPTAASYKPKEYPKAEEGLPWPGCVALHPNPPFEYDPTLPNKERRKIATNMKQLPAICLVYLSFSITEFFFSSVTRQGPHNTTP
jgi:hypothetical protein